MCGRTALCCPQAHIAQCTGVTQWASPTLYHPSANVAPTTYQPVIVHGPTAASLDPELCSSQITTTVPICDMSNIDSQAPPPTSSPPLFSSDVDKNEFFLISMKWGLTTTHTAKNKGPRPINARDDSIVNGKPMFARLRHKHRCVIPAQGFYEWVRSDSGKSLPYLVRSTSGELLWMAGLYSTAQVSDKLVYSYTVITTDNTPALTFLHDRMPVLLSREAVRQWLFPKLWGPELAQLLVPNDDGLLWYPVDPRVNKVGANDPMLMLPYDQPATTNMMDQWVLTNHKNKFGLGCTDKEDQPAGTCHINKKSRGNTIKKDEDLPESNPAKKEPGADNTKAELGPSPIPHARGELDDDRVFVEIEYESRK